MQSDEEVLCFMLGCSKLPPFAQTILDSARRLKLRTFGTDRLGTDMLTMIGIMVEAGAHGAGKKKSHG